mgnify:CR=1 FL=1
MVYGDRNSYRYCVEGILIERDPCRADTILASSLLELVKRSSTSRGRGAPTVELNVHSSNTRAVGFYEHVGFVETGKLSRGAVLVMRRKR